VHVCQRGDQNEKRKGGTGQTFSTGPGNEKGDLMKLKSEKKAKRGGNVKDKGASLTDEGRMLGDVFVFH